MTDDFIPVDLDALRKIYTDGSTYLSFLPHDIFNLIIEIFLGDTLNIVGDVNDAVLRDIFNFIDIYGNIMYKIQSENKTNYLYNNIIMYKIDDKEKHRIIKLFYIAKDANLLISFRNEWNHSFNADECMAWNDLIRKGLLKKRCNIKNFRIFEKDFTIQRLYPTTLQN